ncbi:hypothetical protein BVRB_1g010760 [Beta vulgaris subsp. vulgaris]|nr:hypothetical protein BVRB_1g010760 [Beta vulgaris subsp. vulgaris]
MADSTTSFNPFRPSPPPPHPHPTPVPPPPSLDSHPTVIVIIFISFGCLFLLGALLLCIWWFMKKKRTERKLINERKDIDVDEHLKVQEMIMAGRHGPKKVLVSVEDEIRVHEDVHRSEVDMVGKGLHGKHNEGVAKALESNAGGSSGHSGSSQQLSLPERQV